MSHDSRRTPACRHAKWRRCLRDTFGDDGNRMSHTASRDTPFEHRGVRNATQAGAHTRAFLAKAHAFRLDMVGVAGSIPVAPTSPSISTVRARWHSGLVRTPSRSIAAAALHAVLAALLIAGVRAEAQTLAPLGPLENGRVSFFIAAPPADVELRPGDAELAVWALESWQRAAGGALEFVRTENEDEALVRLYWAAAAGGQYGEMRPIEVDGRRGAAVYVRPDTAALGDDIAVAGTARRSVSRHDRLPDVPARARSCSGSRAYRRLCGRDVLLRLRRRHHGVLRPLPPHAASARRHSCLIWVVARGSRATRGPVRTRCRARRAHGSELAGNTGA